MQQKQRDNKQGGASGGAGTGSVNATAARLKAAQALVREAIKKDLKEREAQQLLRSKAVKKMKRKYICCCGHPDCGIGPFTSWIMVEE